MENIGSIAGLLMVFSALIIVGAILTPFVEKMLVHFTSRLRSAGDVERARKIAQVERFIVQPSRNPDKYRDPQLDDLIQAGQLDEAAGLAAERLRLACERGLDERMEFYRDYARRIDAARRGE